MTTQFSTKKSVLYGAAVTVVFFGLLESVARLAEVMKPPSVALNALSSPKPENGFRIFVYGGSTALGSPVPEYGFVTQLEFWLRAIHPGKQLEIINFAKPGRTAAYARRKLEESISYNPDLLIVLSGHNEFLDRRTESVPDRIVASFALTRSLLRKLDRLQTEPDTNNTAMRTYDAYDRDSSLFKKKVQAYRDNLTRITAIARKHDKPLLLLTAPANVSDWPPVYRGIATDNSEKELEPWIEQTKQLLADGLVDSAIAGIRDKLLTRPDHPSLIYLLAESYAAVGDYTHARELFTKAKDLDGLPWRVLSEFNQTMRTLAEQDGVFLADVEQSFQQQTVQGLVGFSLVGDNCHPTSLGNAIIARDILTLLGKRRLFLEYEYEPSDLDASLEQFLSQTTTPATRRSLELSYLVENAKYSMKTPFFNFSAARMYLDRALAMDPSKWEIWVNLATLALLEDRIAEGRRQLGKAIELRGAPLDRNDRQNAPYLNEALEHSGVSLADF